LDWSTYKKMCDQPDYWSRWMVEQSVELLRALSIHDVAQRLQNALTQTALPAPADFKGAQTQHMFHVQLSHRDAVAGLAGIKLACARGLTTDATRQRGLGGFVAVWEEYCRSLGLAAESKA
jgi:hypothetical protein